MGKAKHSKITLFIIMIILTFALGTGCSKNDGTSDTSNEKTKETSDDTVKKDVEDKDTTDKDGKMGDTNSQTTNNITIPQVEIASYQIPENDALKFVSDMKIGWNLGNTLDANSEENTLTDELQYESSWCGVKTSKEMITKLKEAGFKTVRIPVSWHNHVSGIDYKISEAWLNRVQEVVDYAIDQDMYVILNIHHDISEKYYYPDNKHLKNSTLYVKSIWKQLAERFNKYDDKLILESINEPRLVGTENEWWLDMTKANCKEAVDCINQLNQVFVDTVRASAGNNKTRYLMVPGYCASADGALNDAFVIPKDSKENNNKIIVSVHAYTPYNFALQPQKESGSIDQFSASSSVSQKDINTFMDGLYNKYISKGTPVVIGEFGAMDKKNNLQSRVEYSAYYIAAARARGMIACWWDNNAFAGEGENFGLLDRKTLTFTYPDIINALMKYTE
ncbi:glycoside hydrolase family 5 protein [Anaeromicropila herbilytica]|uniref:Endoglucanase n=1 Tax=Anaeromicropila herbilytica TaxID=2785025 RepID=A0A7R7IC15_9FIRM|nr:glycoside hydrolase family 5 protein [Anaeromicropila herbilytica]BCN29419.1 endoglucanase [Anaeromicropila herbilytica]